jgi:heptaprenyl diphosphate synthase
MPRAINSPRRRIGRSPRRQEILAVFAGACLFLSGLEYILPRPLPFFRIGLSNLPLVLAVEFMDPLAVLALAALKVLGQGVLTGTVVSYVFLFSCAGTLASVTVMYPLARLPRDWVTSVGISSAGALASNLATGGLALVVIFGVEAKPILPVILGIGAAAGLALGLCAEAFKRRSAWLKAIVAAWEADAGQGGAREADHAD